MVTVHHDGSYTIALPGPDEYARADCDQHPHCNLLTFPNGHCNGDHRYPYAACDGHTNPASVPGAGSQSQQHGLDV